MYRGWSQEALVGEWEIKAGKEARPGVTEQGPLFMGSSA